MSVTHCLKLSPTHGVWNSHCEPEEPHIHQHEVTSVNSGWDYLCKPKVIISFCMRCSSNRSESNTTQSSDHYRGSLSQSEQSHCLKLSPTHGVWNSHCEPEEPHIHQHEVTSVNSGWDYLCKPKVIISFCMRCSSNRSESNTTQSSDH